MDAPLIEVLTEARHLGFLGPGPIDVHLQHAEGFVAAAPAPPVRFLDLGSGGGVPGLVLAVRWPASGAVLLEASARRTAFLRRAVTTLDLSDRVQVLQSRAEVAGHDPRWRGRFDLVVARSFGPPALTAEYGAAFLAPGGSLLVSDPPEGGDRWDPDLLAGLGLALGPAPGPVRQLVQAGPYPARSPRRRPGR